MKKQMLWVGVFFAGLLAGQALAESARPVTVVNTLRFGYDDNLYRARSGRRDSSFFIEDVLELGYRASFSPRTDFMAKGRIVMQSDKDNEIYPNLFLMLNHAATPRLLLQVYDTFTTGDKSGYLDGVGGRRHNYWRNTIGANADYVLTERDRVGASGSYTLERGQSRARVYDFNRYDVGLSWARELAPMRTRLTMAWDHAYVDYVKSQRFYGVSNDFHMDSLSAELKHTFNPEWIGYVKGGVTFVDRDFVESSRTTSPLFGAGIAYIPSPRTRLSVDFDHTYSQTDSSWHGGQERTSLSFGAQHDITARITARSTLRFVDSEYDRRDIADPNAATMRSHSEDRIEWDNRVTYRINRMHFVEAGYRHARRRGDNIASWNQNRMDVGWRVQF